MPANFTPITSSAHPRWAKDYRNREHVRPGGAKLDATQFPRDDSVLVKVNNASGEAVGDTTITVDALSGAVPAGATLRFSNGALVYVTAAAIATATSLTVEALQVALTDNLEAVYMGTGRVTVGDGTLVGRTYTERDAGTGFGPAADGDVGGSGEAYLLAYTVDDATVNNDCDLYEHGSRVAENHVPGWDSLSTAQKAYIRDKYICTRAAD
jgi:hypothetical protein